MQNLIFLPRALQKFCESFHAVPGHLTGIREFENLGRAVKNALRVSLAEVAFGGYAVDGVQGHRSDRADIYTHGASNTEILLNPYHPFGFRAMQGAGGAYIHAGRFLAIKAGDRDVLPPAERNDLNPSAPGVAHRMIMEGAD
jgi:hypothetical protein